MHGPRLGHVRPDGLQRSDLGARQRERERGAGLLGAGARRRKANPGMRRAECPLPQDSQTEEKEFFEHQATARGGEVGQLRGRVQQANRCSEGKESMPLTESGRKRIDQAASRTLEEVEEQVAEETLSQTRGQRVDGHDPARVAPGHVRFLDLVLGVDHLAGWIGAELAREDDTLAARKRARQIGLPVPANRKRARTVLDQDLAVRDATPRAPHAD